MSVSINNNITIRDYEIYDDLELVDEKVITNIVNGLFTNTIPDFAEQDPASPYFIRNKPTKTSDFINDGADGTSRYIQINELGELGNVDDVQVKFQGQYESIVVNKIAKLDLTPFVRKELKTGSDYLYKVLSDNNFTDIDKSKVTVIQLGGDGNSALTNNGQYKDLYNILSINGLTPNSQKSITLTANDIAFNNESVYSMLNRSVLYKSSSDKQIVLNNNKSLLGKNTLGTEIDLIKLSGSNKVQLGSSSAELSILSSVRPQVNGNDIAYTGDISSQINLHNIDSTAHADIRDDLIALQSATILKMTNSIMQTMISTGDIPNGQLVFCLDDGTYKRGRVYKFNGTGFDIETDYEDTIIFGMSSPTVLTIGKTNQLYYDINNLEIWICNGQIGGEYVWQNITPSQQSVDVSSIVNNTLLISDENGGFTAGNGYRLLDSAGMIPVARIPQSVLRGTRYGGSFDSTGTITGSQLTPELTGLLIDNINLSLYENYYFLCTGNYVLYSENYVVGNFALSTGSEWVKIDNPGQVVSVNGQTGAVVLTASNVNAVSITDANVNMLTNITPTYSGNTVNIALSSFNLGTQQASSSSFNLGLANTTTAGLMSLENYNQLATNTSAITKLTTSTIKRLIYTASTTPTAVDINNFVLNLGYSSPFTGVEVVINDVFNVWRYYSGTGWVDDGSDTSSLFTNSSAGIILGSSVDGNISANLDGTGSVNGWSTLVSTVNQLSNGLANKLDTVSNDSGNSVTLTNYNGDYSLIKETSGDDTIGIWSSYNGIESGLSNNFVMGIENTTSGNISLIGFEDRVIDMRVMDGASASVMASIYLDAGSSPQFVLNGDNIPLVLQQSDGVDTAQIILENGTATLNGDQIAVISDLPIAIKTAELNV